MTEINNIWESIRTSYMLFQTEFKDHFGIDLDKEIPNTNIPRKVIYEVEFLVYRLVIYIFENRWTLLVYEPRKEVAMFWIASQDYQFLRHYLHITELMLTTHCAKNYKKELKSLYEPEDT